MNSIANAMATNGMEESIAALALMFSLIALSLSWLSYRRDQRVERSAVYLQLETYSSAIFQYEADHEAEMAPFRLAVKPKGGKIAKREHREKVTEQLYYQSLNLFEVASNFRKNEIVEHEVFASWVAWFYELVNDWYFREIWENIRGNYTADVRNIFDAGCLIFETDSIPAEKRRDAFYRVVAQTIEPGGCEAVLAWLEVSADKTKVNGWVQSVADTLRREQKVEA